MLSLDRCEVLPTKEMKHPVYLILARRTRRRLSLFVYFSIVFLLLFPILFCYHLLPSLTPAQISPSSSPSIRIMYVIRTSSKFYQTRLIYQLKTWIPFIQKHVYFVSDKLLTNISQNHLILTRDTCEEENSTTNTSCCTIAHDFLLFHRHQTKYDWFCHFDDDHYVHTKNLEKYLVTLDSHSPHYIGRNSQSKKEKRTKEPFPHSFWYAASDAGVCLSKGLLDLLQPYTQNISQFLDGCLTEDYSDDIYLAFLISAYLNVTLTRDFRFHSHLEKAFYQDKQTFFQIFTKQITFAFGLPHHYPAFLPKLYRSQDDPYRLRALHCLLYPYLFECQARIRQHLFNITN